MDASPSSAETAPKRATLRCGFCLAKNRVDVGRAAHRPRCGKCGRPMLLDRPVKVADADFEDTVLQAEVPVLVDFYADWCQPCRIIAPVLDEIAHDGTGRLLVAKVDTDRSPTLSQRMDIRGIPTLVLFRDGQEVERIVGVDIERLKQVARGATS